MFKQFCIYSSVGSLTSIFTAGIGFEPILPANYPILQTSFESSENKYAFM